MHATSGSFEDSPRDSSGRSWAITRIHGGDDVERTETGTAAGDGVGDARSHAIERVAIFDGDAGDFDSDCGSRRRSQLPHCGGLRVERRAFEALREEALHHVAEAAAEREKRCLRSVPGNQSVRFRGGREIAHDVYASCAGETGRTD